MEMIYILYVLARMQIFLEVEYDLEFRQATCKNTHVACLNKGSTGIPGEAN